MEKGLLLNALILPPDLLRKLKEERIIDPPSLFGERDRPHLPHLPLEPPQELSRKSVCGPQVAVPDLTPHGEEPPLHLLVDHSSLAGDLLEVLYPGLGLFSEHHVLLMSVAHNSLLSKKTLGITGCLSFNEVKVTLSMSRYVTKTNGRMNAPVVGACLPR